MPNCALHVRFSRHKQLFEEKKLSHTRTKQFDKQRNTKPDIPFPPCIKFYTQPTPERLIIYAYCMYIPLEYFSMGLRSAGLTGLIATCYLSGYDATSCKLL